MNKNILILGLGQIGSAIKQIEEEAGNKVNVLELDITPKQNVDSYDIMHVNIPFSDDFNDIVITAINNYSPKLIIVNSTIKPFCIEKIRTQIYSKIVHSPCMGIHPYLYEGIKMFQKIISGDKEACIETQKHLTSIGITSYIYNNNESEFAKLIDTTYYSWNIMFAKYVKHLCDEYNVNFKNVYEITTNIYNKGYTTLNKKNVIRPILYPPGKEGLGGHCCISNAVLLYELSLKNNDSFGMNMSKIILSMGKKSDKTFKDKSWLYCEYIGKEKSIIQIGNECNVSATTISNYMRKFNIITRLERWTNEEDELLKELVMEMPFKEIIKFGLLNKTYTAIRSRAAIKGIKSIYDNTKNVDLKTRIQISCTLQNIDTKDFKGFISSEVQKIRHSLSYKKWRMKVFKRDKWTCQNPNCKYCDNKKGVYLHAHHIKSFAKYIELRFDANNGITYCKDFHFKSGMHKKENEL